MALLRIRKYPEDILRRQALPVENVRDAELQRLIDDMIETMHDAPGIGLAAPQVGVSRRICVIDVSGSEQPESAGPVHVLINPEILDASEQIVAEEGCLSIPGYHCDVKRYGRVIARYTDRDGNHQEIVATDLLCRAIQHELDHLNGVLFVDRIGSFRKELFKRRYKKSLSQAEA
ncbi:MAG: peptide deformylase [Nitrospirae bacterium]|nr:peptide deformylase [Nitrospirota bacterium]